MTGKDCFGERMTDIEKMREALRGELRRAHVDPNLFGSIAQMTAHQYGDEWMDAVVEYVQGNRDFLADGIRTRIPELKCHPQEGTYLMWGTSAGWAFRRRSWRSVWWKRADWR